MEKRWNKSYEKTNFFGNHNLPKNWLKANEIMLFFLFAIFDEFSKFHNTLGAIYFEKH